VNKTITDILPRGLVVSCQALQDEPLHSSFIMSKMALAAKQGGAIAIRANSGKDIKAIKKEVALPIIGIVKKDYDDSEVFITPTIDEVSEIVEAGCEIVALDATNRARPNGFSLQALIMEIRRKYPNIFLMADCATFQDGVNAEKLGFDLIATTLNGYTPDTKGANLPNIQLIKKLVQHLKTPVIAEGGISTPQQAQNAYNVGAYALVVGSAITRPKLITEGFIKAIVGCG